MSNYWPNRRREQGPSRVGGWDEPNYYSPYHESKYFSRNQDRSRSRISSFSANAYYGDNRFNATNRQYRNRGNRRSLSAPRTVPEDVKQRSNFEFRDSYAEPLRPRRVHILPNQTPYNSNDKNNSQESSPVPQAKKFRSIFGLNKLSNDGQIDADRQCLSTEAVSVKDEKPDQTGNIVANINFKKAITANLRVQTNMSNGEDFNSVDKHKCNQQIRQIKPFVNVYGESLTELNKNKIEVIKTKLPVVVWSNNSSSVDNLPEYDSSKAVGGDGITLEVFYLCKYCKMFTGGCQVEAHLKSKYHYDRYAEYLKTGEIVCESIIDNSHSPLETKPDVPKSPVKELESNYRMDIDDPIDIVYNCHQELDFD